MLNELSLRFLDVLKYLIKEGYTSDNKDFASKISVSSSMITEISKGRSNVGLTAIQNTVSSFPINSDWLLTGRGSMLRGYDYRSSEEGYIGVVAEPLAIYGKTREESEVNHSLNTASTSYERDSIYRIYVEDKAEWKAEREELKAEKKELKAKIDHLNNELAETREELAVVKNRFADYKTYSEEKLRQLEAGAPGGKTSAEDASIEKYSSRNVGNAKSANALSE